MTMSPDPRDSARHDASLLAAKLPARATAEDAGPSPSYASLSRVMGRIRALLSPAFDQRFWLRAELGSVQERDGALYGELIEANRQGVVVAKVRCVILPRELASIRARFAEAGLELVLERGTVIGVQCCVQFHEVHGLSLIVRDMDPSFVLGELELRRRRILQGLKRDGLLSHNARCAVPLFPTRILLITSGTSAAYHDFTRTLLRRKYGLSVWLADATMQGPSTEASVLRGLALADELPVDLVVVIRGGGSKLDLGWLDSDRLARAIVALRRPVWTGIGHEIDVSVLDFVAAKAFRTPTAAAEALCTHFEALERRLEDSEARMGKACLSALRLQQEKLGRATHTLRRRPGALVQMRRAELAASANKLSVRVTRRVTTARAAWRTRADRMQRSANARLSDSGSRLQRSHDRLAASASRIIELRARALSELSSRMVRGCSPGRFEAERGRIAHRQRDLQRSSGQRLAAAKSTLQLQVRETETRTAARLARARASIAPKAQQLQGALVLRARLVAARLGALQARMSQATVRQLSQLRSQLLEAQRHFTAERVAARCERERATLAGHARVLRASDPRRALALGYSITYAADGSLVRSRAMIAPGQRVTTHLVDGTFDAVITAAQDITHDEQKR
jgi:exodeoxyribonuclease VII large subunit